MRRRDVVVLVSRPELEAQAEGREELELLGELERSVGALRPVALPAFEAFAPVVAGGVAVVVHHVQDVVLHALCRQRHLVVGAVDVQVVVDGHLHRVLATHKPGVGAVPVNRVSVRDQPVVRHRRAQPHQEAEEQEQEEQERRR